MSNNKVPQRTYSVTNTNLPKHLPLVGLGCSSFSSFFSAEEDNDELAVDTVTREHPAVIGWIETIRHAVLNRGINLLDTAPWYGHGVSETVVGYALDTILSDEGNGQAQRKRTGSLSRSDLIINTKVGRYEADPLKQFDFSYETTIKSVQRSLERMNCSYIDVLQLHDPEFAPSISILLKETIPALLECKRRGWARAIGLTGYPLEVQQEILVKAEMDFPSHANVFDQSLVYSHNNLHDMSLFREYCFPSKRSPYDSFAGFCHHSNIHLMAAAPLSMGLLTHSGPPGWHPAPSALKEACVKAAKLCESEGVNISSLAILYSLSHPSIGCTLLGMKDVEEVDFAADLASRFSPIDFSKESQDSILDQVLTPKESEVLKKLLDETDGPFSQLKNDYRWDGRKLASAFWAMVDEKKQKS
jgi:L-galactose dehydrogenase